jgi:hypothetical protein
MPAFQFNSQGVEPQYGGAGGLPLGKHPVVIVGTDLKPTKDNTGGYLELTIEAIDGPAKGMQTVDRLNLHNKSDVAVRIANQAACRILPRYRRLRVQRNRRTSRQAVRRRNGCPQGQSKSNRSRQAVRHERQRAGQGRIGRGDNRAAAAWGGNAQPPRPARIRAADSLVGLAALADSPGDRRRRGCYRRAAGTRARAAATPVLGAEVNRHLAGASAPALHRRRGNHVRSDVSNRTRTTSDDDRRRSRSGKH